MQVHELDPFIDEISSDSVHLLIYRHMIMATSKIKLMAQVEPIFIGGK